MKRRKFISSIAITTALAGCSTDNLPSPPDTENDETTPSNNFTQPNITVTDFSYDWKTGEQIITVNVDLNGYNKITLKDSGKVISNSGEYNISISDYETSVIFYYQKDGNRRQGIVNIDSDEKLSAIEKSSQLRLLQVNATNGIKKIERESEVEYTEEQKYSWGNGKFYSIQIQQRLYEYYKNRQRVPEYGAYGADPYDKSIIQGIVDEFQSLGNNTNEIVNELLQFVQSMEYTQDSVATGYNEYPKFPIETLVEDGGDCEDTAILLASILQQMGYGVRLILLPDDNHMALGVAGDESLSGTYYKENGTRYYYVETTSKNWRIGQKPDNITGTNAELRKIIGHPTLRGLINPDGLTEGGAPQYNVRIDNLTGYPAESVRAKLEYKSKDGRTISSKQVNVGDLRGEETHTEKIWLAPPPKETEVQLKVTLYESGHIHDEMTSEFVTQEDSIGNK